MDISKNQCRSTVGLANTEAKVQLQMARLLLCTNLLLQSFKQDLSMALLWLFSAFVPQFFAN